MSTSSDIPHVQLLLGSPVPLGGQAVPLPTVGAESQWKNDQKQAVPAGVEALTALVSLQSLNLMRCTRVTDVGAGHLCGLSALACVNLSECPCLSRDALDTLAWHVQVRWRLQQMAASPQQLILTAFTPTNQTSNQTINQTNNDPVVQIQVRWRLQQMHTTAATHHDCLHTNQTSNQTINQTNNDPVVQIQVRWRLQHMHASLQQLIMTAFTPTKQATIW